MKTLYVCYSGLRQPLVQTQCLPYLRELSKAGIEVLLLTFEPRKRRSWSSEKTREWQARLEADGIHWFSLAYHKWPSLPATLLDIITGAWFSSRLAREHGVDVIHARSHVPVAMALLAKALTRCKVIFDIRGLIADEYADAGIWKAGSPTYRAVKWLERIGVKSADQLVVLTERVRSWLLAQDVPDSKIEVIPCCVKRSAPSSPHSALGARAEASDRFELVYAGSAIGLYLLEEMARFFIALRKHRADAFFRVLTKSPPGPAKDVLRRAGLGENEFWVGAAEPDEVAAFLRRARLGISFRRPSFSQMAASPTKIPEYLAAGLPVVTNAGIGDTDDLIERFNVGVVVRAFNADAYEEAVGAALALAADPRLKRRCEEVVKKYFDLSTVGAARYLKVYQRILNASEPAKTVAATA